MSFKQQQGGTIIGFIVGVLVGLGAALAVAVYVTKVPVPFMNKGQNRTAEQDAAEAQRNRNWDPNAPLQGKSARPAASGAVGAAAAASAPAASASTPAPKAAASAASAPATATARPAASAASAASARNEPKAPAVSADPLGDLARARAGGTPVDPFQYYIQVGAFRSAEDAEAQRAKLSLIGLEAKVTEREQAGRTVFRVRVGPFDSKDEADKLQQRLESSGLEAALVRAQR